MWERGKRKGPQKLNVGESRGGGLSHILAVGRASLPAIVAALRASMAGVPARPTGDSQARRRNARCTGVPACRSRMTGWPSRPGEFHPEPLTEPDVSLSTYPARATHRRLPPSAATSGFLLGAPVDPIGRVASDPLPSLHGHYPASPLLRSSPPLLGASVLSA